MIWRSRCRSHCANYCKRGICRRLAPTRKRSETRQGLSRIHVLQQVAQIDLVEGVITTNQRQARAFSHPASVALILVKPQEK